MNSKTVKTVRFFCAKAVALALVMTFAFSDVAYFLSHPFEPLTNEAEAAQVTIDADVWAAGTGHLQAGSQTVFVDDQTGYKFFRDIQGMCVYRKTTDGGTSWTSTTSVDSQLDCVHMAVWYDRWTPGDQGTIIHIATLDTNPDRLWYNQLDTSDDSRLMGSSPVNAAFGQTAATFTEGANTTAITKGTDGTVYLVANDNTDSYIIECSGSCNATSSWSETGTASSTLQAQPDYNLLLPLSGGDIMLINRDIDQEDIRYKIWNNTSWSGSWTTIDGNATDNTAYDVGMAAAVSSTTGQIYLAYIARNTALGLDDQIRAARYTSGWATTTDPVATTTAPLGSITNLAIALDASNDDVYVAYSGRLAAGAAGTANLYYKVSTDDMATWGPQIGPVNSGVNDIYGVDFTMTSDERIYATWFHNTGDDILGETIADVYPGIYASTTGRQVATTTASTTNVYIGGAFTFHDHYKSHDITGITITESGTIDGSSDLTNIKLLYETDSVAPYDCASVSYDGNEDPFGSTDTNGFSGADGVSSFTGTTLSVSTTTAYCVYVVMNIEDTAPASSTIDIRIENASDITVTDSSVLVFPSQMLKGSTTVINDTPTQIHYHFRNDDGGQSTSTSRTSGVEDTSIPAIQKEIPVRIRLEVSNEGATSTPTMAYRLEYGSTTGLCSAVTTWVDVGAGGGEFDMSDSVNLTDGADTTNIATTTGGVTNENNQFLSPNGGVRDTTSVTGALQLTVDQYVELEYSVVSTAVANDGTTYCFRLSNGGQSYMTYSVYPRLTISADVLVVAATSSQIATTSVPVTNEYIGSAFVISENVSSRNVTDITITESGSVDASLGLDNIELYYELDTSSPYNCAGEGYGVGGAETPFGLSDTDGFSAANGTSTFSGTVAISTTSTMCVYVVLDVTGFALNEETIEISINSPPTDVLVSGGGTVSPTSARDLNGSTTLVGAVLTQTHYHFRNDTGGEASSTSMTGGIDDTPVTYIAEATPVRIRLQVSNEGSVSSAPTVFRIDYGAKLTTCSAITSWTDVGALDGAFDMYDSSNIRDASSTINIGEAEGGMPDENTQFLSPNEALKDASSTIATTTLTAIQFLEAEFSIIPTADAGFNISYCFRLTNNGTALGAYTVYPELTTSPERDFEIQRNTVFLAATTTTLTAGVHYTAPAASTSAFIRITNIAHTGAGNPIGGTQNADDVTAYISNPWNIMTSVNFVRPNTNTGTTSVAWEIVEFIGAPGSDNEMIVREQKSVIYGASDRTATGSVVANIGDDADIVVFITGQGNPDTGTADYNTGLSTSRWLSASDQPNFERGEGVNDAAMVSYAVVEFTGPNWAVQRSEHSYHAAGVTETESITPVNNLTRAFLHTQKRVGTGLAGMDEYGHEVWFSGTGVISYFLETAAGTSTGQVSVAWVIENTQTSEGAMEVTRSGDNTTAGTVPFTFSKGIGKTLEDLTNASIFTNARGAGTGAQYPRPLARVAIASSTHYELWRTETAGLLTFRTEVVEWPTAGLALRQNSYRLYEDNDALDPTEPWATPDLGQNTALTATDDPLGEGDHIRIRMSLRALNATFPAGTKAFKLQYGIYDGSCSAISNWVTLGDAASSTVWRAYDAPGVADGTTISVLNLTGISDVLGTYEEANDSAVNPSAVQEGEDIEYDWHIQQNGAVAETDYCFRMVESNGTELGSYPNHPQIRTASFSPRTQNWRWYEDEQSVTPTTTLAAENVAPIEIAGGQGMALRVTVKEIKNIARDDVRFKLQYSEYADFSSAYDVLATTSCTGSTTWCYSNGGAADNAVIASSTLSDAVCVGGVGDGCGTHNESPDVLTGFRHENSATAEYSFTIVPMAPRPNRVYYFRLYDVVQDIPVVTNTGESYPSLVTEGASLVFGMSGVASGSTTEGVTTDTATSPVTIDFGALMTGDERTAAHRLTVDANATEGYQLFVFAPDAFSNSSGDSINGFTGTNATPAAWGTGCAVSAAGCFGYHVGDDSLQGGSARFSPNDTYARLSTTSPEEIMYSSLPVAGEFSDIIYRIRINELQEAGQYVMRMVYIAVPIF